MIYIKRWIDYYEELFTVEEGQEEFFTNLGNSYDEPAKLLSVECGPSALSQKLVDKFDITATDTYSEFVNIAKTRQNNLQKTYPVFNLNPADLGRYLGKNFYHVIYCLNYRLIFMKDKAVIWKFLIDAKALLKEGGCLVLDLFNFSKYDFSETKIDLPEIKCDRATLYSSIIKNSDTTSYKLFQHVVTSSGKLIDEVKDEDVCPISYETFKTFASELGYSSIEFYSDYKKSPLTKESDKIICVLKK